MAATAHCVAQLSRMSMSSSVMLRPKFPARFLIPAVHIRHKSGPSKKGKTVTAKKKKGRSDYRQYDMKNAEQFSLCDAMRYIRAFEVGQMPTSVKYEMALKLKSVKNGPVIRNRLRLPHPVQTDIRICVICPRDSKQATAALEAGAVLVGEEEIFEAVKAGRIDFDRCLCVAESAQKLNKAGLGRVLGPRGLMPTAKTGTVVKDAGTAVRQMVGAAEYREKLGVVRMAVGQLGFTPAEMQRNIRAFVQGVRGDAAAMSEKASKEIAEVVLSSTNGPGFSLSGEFNAAIPTITPEELSTG